MIKTEPSQELHPSKLAVLGPNPVDRGEPGSKPHVLSKLAKPGGWDILTRDIQAGEHTQ
jgi:hypothetical protein